MYTLFFYSHIFAQSFVIVQSLVYQKLRFLYNVYISIMNTILSSTHDFAALGFIFLILIKDTLAAGSTCYNSFGLVQPNSQRCNVTAEVSTCCDPGFVCLSNGLCTPGPDNDEVLQYKYLKSGCTDKEFGERCPTFCPNRAGMFAMRKTA